MPQHKAKGFPVNEFRRAMERDSTCSRGASDCLCAPEMGQMSWRRDVAFRQCERQKADSNNMSMQLPMIWPSVETEHENAKEKETEIESDRERDRGRQSSKFIGQGDFFR